MSAPNTANGMLRDSTTIKGITGSNDLLGAIEVCFAIILPSTILPD